MQQPTKEAPMGMVKDAALFAKDEVRRAVEEMQRVLRKTLPVGSFAEREAAALAITNEVLGGALREELQAVADEFPDTVLVDGVAYKRHQKGMGRYHSLCGPLRLADSRWGCAMAPPSCRWNSRQGWSRERRRPWPTTWRTGTGSTTCGCTAR